MTVKRLINILIIILCLLPISEKTYGVLHFEGSFESQSEPGSGWLLWLKIKQDLIKRKGLVWLLSHPDLVQVYLLNDGSDCGLFVYGKQGIVLSEIKNSLDILSRSNDTVIVPYGRQIFKIENRDLARSFDFKRYQSEVEYRNLIDINVSNTLLRYIKIFDHRPIFTKYWFLSDISLYQNARRLTILDYVLTHLVINIGSVLDEYITECNSLGFEPLYISTHSDPAPLPSRIIEQGDINPEIQLLHKYVKKNDSILLNTPTPKDIFNINFIYDHDKLEHTTPMIIDR